MLIQLLPEKVLELLEIYSYQLFQKPYTLCQLCQQAQFACGQP